MTLPAVTAALDGIDEKSCCAGTYRLPERLAIALPDGDVGAADDPKFVSWLLAHSEPAPFGDAGKTRIDESVRRAQRLTARGKAQVVGFQPADILDEIEAALSPRMHLAATLTDVITYPEGGKFSRHKDTPRTPDLVGTLVVGVAVEHQGGAFHVEDGRSAQDFDWSGPQDPSTVRWVALYSDVDHEVKPVTSGARVTLVYALTLTGKPRVDPTWDARRDQLRTAIGSLARQTAWPVLMACTRHVITDQKPLQGIEALRGIDRDLADAIIEAGFKVAVRSCLAATPTDRQAPTRFPDTGGMYRVARLAQPLTPKIIAALDELVMYSETAEDDEGGEDIPATSLAPYILDHVPLDQWVVRKNAEATMVHETLFSEDGYFGNEGYEAYLYTLAALEVSR